VKWLADENFDNDILRGLRRRAAEFDVLRVQDIAEIAGEPDPVILAWATARGRALSTHDLSTMIGAMHEQLRLYGACAPILLVPESLPTAVVIEDVLLLNEFAIDQDWLAGILYLPLR
jgi:hypothetical protein